MFVVNSCNLRKIADSITFCLKANRFVTIKFVSWSIYTVVWKWYSFMSIFYQFIIYIYIHILPYTVVAFIRPCLHKTGMKLDQHKNWNCLNVYMRLGWNSLRTFGTRTTLLAWYLHTCEHNILWSMCFVEPQTGDKGPISVYVQAGLKIR